ncbi:hypothetical protein NDU88_001625 [Pleurodeles waltl]|uniref:Uncharacterized protein n=1 Tax=Pleurodeles waltl TaxID=8319 RepID=A0AAV7U7R2_PLEWA|nr:hypothetical protein NDU88_001625 [Pleurodeles waltl]
MAPQFLKPASRVPGRPVGSAVRYAFGTRLFSPPGHEQAWKQEAAAPGESAIGAAAAAPPAPRHSRVSAPPCTRTEGRSRHKLNEHEIIEYKQLSFDGKKEREGDTHPEVELKNLPPSNLGSYVGSHI